MTDPIEEKEEKCPGRPRPRGRIFGHRRSGRRGLVKAIGLEVLIGDTATTGGQVYTVSAFHDRPEAPYHFFTIETQVPPITRKVVDCTVVEAGHHAFWVAQRHHG
jgi:hypothetical protein